MELTPLARKKKASYKLLETIRYSNLADRKSGMVESVVELARQVAGKVNNPAA